MSNELTVTPERVVEILVREPLGAALWRAAANEAMVEVYRDRVEQLEKQKSPATSTPTSSTSVSPTRRPGDDPPAMAVGQVYPNDPKPQPLSGSRHAE